VNEIKFNCPQCGQPLAVDATGAGLTVACPKCGQAINVPQLARQAASPAPPRRTKWWLWLSVGITVLALVAGLLIWQTHRRPAVKIEAAAAKPNATESNFQNARLTSEMLNGKRFRFSWKTEKDNGDHGILTFHTDGTLSGGSGSPNETFWSIDDQGRLTFKHRDGRISTIFTNANQRDGKWLLSGQYQFNKSVEHLLGEVGPETSDNPPQSSFGGIGVQLDKTNGVLLIKGGITDSPAGRARIKIGSTIISIDGLPVENMALKDAVNFLRGPVGTTVKMVIVSPEGQQREFSLTREKLVMDRGAGDLNHGGPAAEQKSNEFQAIGLREPVRTNNWADAVRVLFPGLPYSMVFKPPCVAAYALPGGIMSANGYCETSMGEGGGPYELVQDQEIRHVKMWIENATPARAVVKFRGALVNHNYVIAHTDTPSGSPWGQGDWAEETFYIYPDGICTREVEIWTGVALRADSGFLPKPLPGRIPFESQETHVIAPDNHQPTNDIETGGVTLIRMNGTTRTVLWNSYPPFEDLFPGANIQVVNLKQSFKPFVIVPANLGFEFIPYYGGGDDFRHIAQTLFVTWTDKPLDFKHGYTAALTHIVSPQFYQRTKNTLTQLYLCGITRAQNDADKAVELTVLAKSWLYAPSLRMVGQSWDYVGYDKLDRAYHIKKIASTPDESLKFTIDANTQSPIQNPAFVIKGWGAAKARVIMNGNELKNGDAFRCGHENNSLVIWLKTVSTTPVQLVVESAGQ
jgi:hypothetical protein